MPMPTKLSLDVLPAWEELERVRQRTKSFLEECALGSDVVDAVSMVACELLENAIKYGAFSAAAPAIKVDVTVSPTMVMVEIQNPVGPDSATLHRLDEAIQWIRGYQDPFEAYLKRLKEVSGQRLDSTESGLGLVRIAYEGQSVLDFFVNEHDVLAVSAVHRVAPARRLEGRSA